MAPEQLSALAIVEDSDEDFAMFSRVFRSWGTISRWADAESALEAFRSGEAELGTFETLVVDLHLPGMDGCELIEAARALPGGDRPMVCILSSSERPSDIRRAEEAGADGYVIKPNDVAGLRALPERLAQIAAGR